jgi:hypothetical protein
MDVIIIATGLHFNTLLKKRTVIKKNQYRTSHHPKKSFKK